nr:hypothetical protein [uncultured Niameybacter sp.]
MKLTFISWIIKRIKHTISTHHMQVDYNYSIPEHQRHPIDYQLIIDRQHLF